MINITKSALSNNRVAVISIFIFVAFGIMAYQNFSRDDMPPFTLRGVSIVTYFPGAGPDRVEALVTDPIEAVAQEIASVKNITSSSRTGLSIIRVNLTEDVPKEKLQPIWDELRRKIEGIQGDLPEDIVGPDVRDGDLITYGIQLSMTADGLDYNEMKTYAEDFRSEFIKLPDASKIEIVGLQEEQVFIEYDDAQLARLGLSAGQLQNFISNTNILFPAGDILVENERIVLEPTGNFENLEDLKKTVIPLGQTGEAVYLGDITTIKKGYKTPPEQLVTVNQEKTLVIAVGLKENANIIKLGKDVDEKVKAINDGLPIGMQLTRIASQDLEVESSVNNFISNLLQSVLVVLLVTLAFLGFRTGLVVASLVPMTILMTFAVMSWTGVGLNQVSLAGLIMALGLLVDNAIVMSESIMVKTENGKSIRDAGIQSGKELMIPLLISSLTTSAAFMAFYLAQSTMGEMVGQLFIVISGALLSSWLLALTLIPLLALVLLKVRKKGDDEKDEKETTGGFIEFLKKYYKSLLVWSLNNRITVVITVIVLLFASLYLFKFIPYIFAPDSERPLVTVDVNLPLGTKIERTQEVVTALEDFIVEELKVSKERPEGVVDWTNFVGKGPKSYDLGYQQGEANSSYAHLLVNTTSSKANYITIEKLDAYALSHFPDADVSVKLLALGGSGGADVEVRLKGEDPNELFAIMETIKQKMRSINGTKNIGDDWGPRIKKIVVDIDNDKAFRAGVSNQDIALSIRTNMTGFVTSEFREGKNTLPIMMRSANFSEQDIESIAGLNIFSQSTGRNVPLEQVADIRANWQFSQIKRRDLYRTMAVTCDVKENITPSDVLNELEPWLTEEAKNWTKGYEFSFGGESEKSAEGIASVVKMLPLSLFIMILLLVMQFNSFRKTFIIFATIPLGITGVVLGLLLANSFFSFFGILGVISLAGIVINDSIVLVDKIDIALASKNYTPLQAVIKASVGKFRPVILTTLTTSLGLIPLWIGGGLLWEPMAIGIIFGLFYATLIILIFVPVLYCLLFRIRGERLGI